MCVYVCEYTHFKVLCINKLADTYVCAYVACVRRQPHCGGCLNAAIFIKRSYNIQNASEEKNKNKKKNKLRKSK